MTQRTEARELAVRLHGMDEVEIRAWASTQSPVRGQLTSRDVFYVGDALVLKLAPDPLAICPCWQWPDQDCFCQDRDGSHSYGYGQNEAEAALWRALTEDIRQHFAEVYATSGDGFWLIQERVVPLQGYEQMPNVLWDIKFRVNLGDFEKRNCGHRHLEESDGTERWIPVIFDYGISHLWEEMTGETHMSLIAKENWRTVQLPDA